MKKLNFTPLNFLARLGLITLTIASQNAIALLPVTPPQPVIKQTISTQKAPSPFPLSSTVSYDSLRIMAYSGQSEQAIQLAEAYLKTHENSSVRVLLARMLAWDKQYDAAREQLHFVLSKHPGDYDASDCLSDIEVWEGNYSRAIDALNNALKYDPQNEKLLEKREIIRGKMLVSQGHRDQAIQIAQDFIKTHDSTNMRIYLASQLSANKQYDAARKILEEVLSKKANNTDASIALANIESATDNYSKALEVINDGLKFSPQNSDLLQNKKYVMDKLHSAAAASMPSANLPLPAIVLSGKKNLTPANILPAQQNLALQSNILPAAQNSSIRYDQLNKMAHHGQRMKAIKLAEDSLKQEDNSDIRILLGLMLSWEGRYDEARTQLQLVLKKKPDSLDAIKALANVELWSHHNKSALVVINKGLKYYPRDKDLLKQRNRALGLSSNTLSYNELRKMYTSGQPAKAKQLAQEYLKNKENVDIRLLLGLMESWDKDYDNARTQFDIVLKNSPGYSDASLALADVYTYQNNYISALNVINTALKYHPTNTDLKNKRASIIQNLNQANIVTPGLFSQFNIANVLGPSTPGKKLNAYIFNQEMTYVDDLKETWKITSLGYERYTPYGPVIFTINQTDRFNTAGTQFLGEAYPHLFEGAYMYLGYGYSGTSYLARNYIGFEPFFSLPHAYEFSIGERILQFSGGITHLYTGSIAKYIGNYWFSLRPYYTGKGSRSYHLTARRYFSSPDSYIGLTIGGGVGPSNFDLFNPNSISSNRSRSIRLDGDVPLTDNLIFTWLVAYSTDHFPTPTSNIRQETDLDAGLIWRF